jgi:hypothetical protein
MACEDPQMVVGNDGETQTGGASSESRDPEIIANLGTRSQNTYWERKYIDADNAVPRSVHFGINEDRASSLPDPQVSLTHLPLASVVHRGDRRHSVVLEVLEQRGVRRQTRATPSGPCCMLPCEFSLESARLLLGFSCICLCGPRVWRICAHSHACWGIFMHSHASCS